MAQPTHEQLKEIFEKMKVKLSDSAAKVHLKSTTLTKKVGLLKFHENLKDFNFYLCSPHNHHNHTANIVPVLRNYIIKRSDVDESTREDYLTEITSHIDTHNKMIKVRAALKHKTVHVFESSVVMKKYETFFVDDAGKKKANLDLVELALNAELEKNNGGKALISELTFFEYSKNKEKPSTKVLAKISYKDLLFNNYGCLAKFTNGEERKIDFYKDAIYYKDIEHGIDGKLGTYEIYKGEKAIPESPETKEEIKDSIINNIINDKETTNDEPIN